MGTTHQLTILDVNHCDNGCFTVDINGRIREASLNVKGKIGFSHILVFLVFLFCVTVKSWHKLQMV